ncbi:MAG TPA: DUF4199 domain-containing protein [Pyrinomonadaceae bacterium]|nr:DUF4199 domain-containing protein [Pyrinomonadaceae bacterium]
MKKTVLIFGLISGAISSVLMVATVPFIYQIGFENGTIVGYTWMVLSFLMVFFGIRSYRENVGGGYISFGRAFTVGILIALISSLMYVATWQVVFQNWMYDFPERYTNYMVEKARASGVAPEEVARQRDEWNNMWALYKSSLLVRIAFSFIEPFPVGLLVTLISAGVLRKRKKEEPAMVS